MLRILAAALLVTPAAPATAAAAAPAQPQVRVAFSQTTVSAEAGTSTYAPIFGLRTDSSDDPVKVAFTADFSAVTAFATVEFIGASDNDGYEERVADVQPSRPARFDGSPCSATSTGVSCVLPEVTSMAGFPSSLAVFEVTPAATAKVGDEGPVRVTTRVDDGPAVTTESLIRIGEPVDLSGGSHERLLVAPGQAANFYPQVTNSGTTPVTGVVLGLPYTPPMYTGGYRNCEVGLAVVCSFATTLLPGRTYRVVRPIPVTPPRTAVAGSRADIFGSWLTAAAFEDLRTDLPELNTGQPGTGPELQLALVPGTASTPQVDVLPNDNDADLSFSVTGARRTDLKAVGAQLTGAVGDILTFKVGFTNSGPGTLLPTYFSNNMAFVQLSLPSNLKLIRFDSRCNSDGAFGLTCDATTAAVGAGRSSRFDLTARVTERRPKDGFVVVGTDRGADPIEAKSALTNNRAKLTFTPRKAAGAEAGAGADPGLPISGPSTTIGLLLVAAGVVLLRLGRRRRDDAPSAGGRPGIRCSGRPRRAHRVTA